MQVLVGPADAAGMDPVAVGTAPFSVVSSEAPYLIQGGGPISYDNMETFDWGTYAVTLSMDTTISGECAGPAGNETLNLVLEGTGEQLLVVDASDFHGEYPWAGTNRFDLAFPLQDGASVQGEGYVSGHVAAVSGPFPGVGAQGNVTGEGWGFMRLSYRDPGAIFSIFIAAAI